MKKLPSILLAAALLAACTADKTVPVPEVPATPEEAWEERELILTATAEGAPDTRTVIQDETKVFWQPGDAVKLFFDGQGSKFISTNTEPAGVAQFSGTLNVLVGFNDGFSAERPLWGLYPWREDATADNGSVTTTLPADQVGLAGSFAKNSYITLGRSESLAMGFRGVCGGLRFSLSQEGIRQVEFESLGGEPLAGRITLAFEEGLPTVQAVSDGHSRLTLTLPGGAAFQTGVWYYFVALPGTLEQGFKLVFHRGSRIAEYRSDKSVTVKRSIFGSLGHVDEGLEFKLPDISDMDDPIVFADDRIKARLVAAFDTNADGELSYREADAVTSVKDVFSGETDFTSFDEFRFFTSVTEVPHQTFRSWTQLRSIRFPESVRKIGKYAFYLCSSLQEIQIPPLADSLDSYAFSGCTALKQLVIPETVTYIGESAFRKCSSLDSLSLPSTMTEIGTGLFRECISLTSIRFPEGLTTIGSNAFIGCSGLQGLTFPEDLTIIGASAFENCSGLGSLTLPASVTAIRAGAFRGCTGLKEIHVLPTTPPSGGSGMFDNTGNCPIYVPTSTSTVYTTAAYWKDYLSRLRAEGGGSPYYTSSDYSRDGEVVTLQSASEGRGVNFILLGDGYLDRDMDPDGKYEQRMRNATEALFAYEPYRSERARFNVYTVKVVSANEQYKSEVSDRRLTYDSGSDISFRSSVAIQYALKAPNTTGQPVKVAVLCNSGTRVGRSYCLRWNDGRACCILFDPNTNVLVHELCGHGFGDLWDEYTEKSETFTDTAGLDRDWEQRQWGANTDWRNDPATVRWAHLLADSRYNGENLGIFEGAKLYPKGIYRPTNNSMMRHNNCPFNAPSREQIYKNIMKWSVGSGWTYDYETFVAADEAGRQQAAGRLKAPAQPTGEQERQYQEEHIPPLLVDDGVKEVAFPLSGPPVPHFIRQ